MKRVLRTTIGVALFCLSLPSIAAPVLWIGATRLGEVTSELGKVDVATGAVEVVGDLGFLSFDIAFDPNGNLFGIDQFGQLWSVNPTTASSNLIGDSVNANSLVFASDGTLYAANDRLYTIDPTTGQETEVGNGGTAYSSTGDLAFIGGELYLTSANIAGLPTQLDEELIRIDTATGAGTFVGTVGSYNYSTATGTGFLGVYGLATDNGVDLYGAAGTQIIDIDPATGMASLILDYSGSGLGFAQGSAFYSESGAVIPVPAAAWLFASGLGLLGWLNRRAA